MNIPLSALIWKIMRVTLNVKVAAIFKYGHHSSQKIYE